MMNVIVFALLFFLLMRALAKKERQHQIEEEGKFLQEFCKPHSWEWKGGRHQCRKCRFIAGTHETGHGDY